MNVVVEGERSDSAYVESGVPQGTVIGPLMFCVTLTIYQTVSNRKYDYSQMTALSTVKLNLEKDYQILQSDLKELENWAAKWGMRFNTKKCYILSIRQKSSHFFQLDGEILQQVDSNLYLELTISDNCSMFCCV